MNPLNILKAIWKNKVDLIILIFSMELCVAHYITGKDFTVFIAVMCLYVMGVAVRLERLRQIIEENVEDNIAKVQAGLDSHKFDNRDALDKIMDAFFFVVFAIMLVMAFFIMIKQ